LTGIPRENEEHVIIETVGTTLRRHREAKRMGLAEVSRVTRIPQSTLEAIEQDHFDGLPGEVFVKGFLKSYAQTVGLVPDDVVARYAASRRASAAYVTPLPVASPVQAAREGRPRFGVAIALVLLLILFTLALSIVLKPRGRDMPPELSDATDATEAPPGAPAVVTRAS